MASQPAITALAKHGIIGKARPLVLGARIQVHINGAYYPAETLAGDIQEVQAYNAELSNVSRTGVNPQSIISLRGRYLGRIMQASPAAFRAVGSGNFNTAFQIAEFEGGR